MTGTPEVAAGARRHAGGVHPPGGVRPSACAAVLATALAGCISLPLPDAAPALHRVPLPRAGDDIAAVRLAFGTPPLLDDGQHLVYDWSTNRRLVIVPLLPSGLPAAAVVDGPHFRLLVEVDAEQRVATVACAVAGIDRARPQAPGCLDASALARAATPDGWRRLGEVVGLAAVRFWNAELAGAATAFALSPGGRWLAGADTQHRTWLVDLGDGLGAARAIGRHDGAPPRFWSWRGVPAPQPAFLADGQWLLAAQGEATALLQAGPGLPQATLAADRVDIGVAQPARSGGGFVALGTSALWLVEPPRLQRLATGHEAVLRFDARGAVVARPVAPGQPAVVALDSSALEPSPRAWIGAQPAQRAVLDARNAFARQATRAGYAFSPDGQWLARNACHHLAWWDADELAAALAGAPGTVIAPRRVAILALPPRPAQDARCHAPVVFSADGTWVAAAGPTTIQVWRVADGQPWVFIDLADAQAAPGGLHVVALALGRQRELTAVVSNHRGDITLARWALTLP